MSTSSKKTTTQQDSIDYLKFLSEVKLIGLGLKSSLTFLDRKIFFDLVDRERKPERRFSEEYKPTAVGEEFFEAEGSYEITVGDGDEVGLRIKCSFEVHMHGPAPIDPKLAERFASSDLRFVLSPFARQFVANATAQMQIPPILIPLATAAGEARITRARKE
jgi:hypothetical protein